MSDEPADQNSVEALPSQPSEHTELRECIAWYEEWAILCHVGGSKSDQVLAKYRSALANAFQSDRLHAYVGFDGHLLKMPADLWSADACSLVLERRPLKIAINEEVVSVHPMISVADYIEFLAEIEVGPANMPSEQGASWAMSPLLNFVNSFALRHNTNNSRILKKNLKPLLIEEWKQFSNEPLSERMADFIMTLIRSPEHAKGGNVKME